MSGAASENSRKRPSTALLTHSADADIFDLGVIEDPVLGPLAADSRFLDAAERRRFSRDDAGVQSDDSVLYGFRNPPASRQVARIEVGGQAELRVVGHCDLLRLPFKLEQRRPRTEAFLPPPHPLR